MGKPTYDEITKLYKDCELQRENLVFENDELKDRIIKAIEFIKIHQPIWNEWHYCDYDVNSDIKHLYNILKGSDEE